MTYATSSASGILSMKRCGSPKRVARILDETRTRLAERLGAGAAEIDSVLAILGSRLELSIARILVDPDRPD